MVLLVIIVAGIIIYAFISMSFGALRIVTRTGHIATRPKIKSSKHRTYDYWNDEGDVGYVQLPNGDVRID